MWQKLKLADVCILRNGRAYKKPELLKEGKYRVLRVGNFFTNKNWYYSDLELDDTKYCDSGDLLYAWSASFGARLWKGEKVIYHYHIWRVDINEEIIDKRFLFYWFEFDKELIKAASGTGTTMMHVSKSSMEKREINLPPLAEQQRIVAKLDATFAEIDTAIKTAERKEIEVQCFRTSLLSASISSDALMWKTKTLSDVIERGETINPTNNPNANFSYIDVSSVDRSSFRISETQTLLGKDAPSRARRAVRTGDILFATIRPTLRRVAIVPEELNNEVCSTGYIVLRPKASIICSKFIFYFMLSEKVKTEMEGLQAGASYPAVNDTQVKNLHISFPPLAEQQRIVAKLFAAFAEIDTAIEAIGKSKTNYQALKSAILARELQSEAA